MPGQSYLYYELCNDFNKAIDWKYGISCEECVTNICPNLCLDVDGVIDMKKELFYIMKSPSADYTSLASKVIEKYTGYKCNRRIGKTQFSKCYNRSPWRTEFISKVGYTARFRDFAEDTYSDAIEAGY